MPHVIIKLLAGRSEAQKTRMAADVTKAVMAGAGCGEAAVSVSIQDVAADRWTEDVYDTDIAGTWDKFTQEARIWPEGRHVNRLAFAVSGCARAA